ncbi:MAG TPA: argininosuccinate lyase [Gemmatales bacterium]|nr:argininosuccinate lyase [Gemmatales bacterium]
MAESKTWGGRFGAATDQRVELFTESISFDHRLAVEDIRASQAHARMLARIGVVTKNEADQLCAALAEIGARIAAGQLPFSTRQEDIHTHVENALIEMLGDVGRKLHTARSRNDQVATDLRLWVRQASDDLDLAVAEMQRALIRAARREQAVVLPGYTHLQRAQPVLAAHVFLAYVEKLARDRSRLADARRRLNELPLGAAALAGTSLPIDRQAVAQELGFDRVAANSLDAVSDRDFALEFVFVLTTLALHLSGWAEEWIIWSTVEFGMLELPDAFCTGSSMMPHKKNPDVLELIRGKSARVVGALQQLITLIKGLPLAYNRDLQEDKRPVFEAFDTVLACVQLATPLIDQSRLRRTAIAARIEEGHLDATTLMERLVRAGVPLRLAHEAVGRLVQAAEDRQCRLSDLPPEVFEAAAPGSAAYAAEVLGTAQALAAFRSPGSTAPAEVEKQLRLWEERLGPTTA